MQMKPQQLKIELGEKEAEGIYANMVMIAHSGTEMILDFARIMPGAPKTKVQARIIMTPAHAKLLQKTLDDNLKKFEKQFGEIKIPGGPDALHAGKIGFETSGNGDEKSD